MKLNQGFPMFRYEIANFFKISEKKLYRLLKKKGVILELGMVLPCQLDEIETIVLGVNFDDSRFKPSENI